MLFSIIFQTIRAPSDYDVLPTYYVVSVYIIISSYIKIYVQQFPFCIVRLNYSIKKLF